MSISAAAELLDRNVPGWFNKIDIDTLDMSDGEKCILGQLFADEADDFSNGYAFGCDLPWLKEFRRFDYKEEFGASSNIGEWVSEIKRRRTEPSIPVSKIREILANKNSVTMVHVLNEYLDEIDPQYTTERVTLEVKIPKGGTAKPLSEWNWTNRVGYDTKVVDNA